MHGWLAARWPTGQQTLHGPGSGSRWRDEVLVISIDVPEIELGLQNWWEGAADSLIQTPMRLIFMLACYISALLGRLELLSGGLEFSGCWQYYKGSHSIIKSGAGKSEVRAGELCPDVRWWLLSWLMNPSPRYCRRFSGTGVRSSGQDFSSPLTALGGHIQLRLHHSPVCFFLYFLPSFHHFMAHENHRLYCLIFFVLFYPHFHIHFPTTPHLSNHF